MDVEPKGMKNDDVLSAPRREGTVASGGSPSPRGIAGALIFVLLVGASIVVGGGPAAAASIGTIDHFPLGPDLADARQLTVGPDGNMWFVSITSDAIGRVTPDGVVTAFTHPEVADPVDITAGPDGNLWFVAQQWTPSVRGVIGRLTPTGTFTLYPSTRVYRPSSIVPGPDGKLWFTDDQSTLFYGGQVGTITTDGTITVQPTGDDGFYPSSIEFGPDGVVWLSGGGHIGWTDLQLSWIYDRTEMTDLRGWDLVPGDDGEAWFLGTASWPPGATEILRVGVGWDENELDRFGSYEVDPADLAAGTNGSVWFADPAGSIGRVAADGTLTTTPTPGATPQWLTVGSDGSVWFLGGGTAIGRMSGSQVETFAAAAPVGTVLVPGSGDDLWFAEGSSAIARIEATPPAGVPVFVEAEPGKGQATVSWHAPPTPLAPITGYEVVATSGGSGCTTTGATSCVIGGLTAGTAYSFTVRALGSGGPGPWSASTSSVLPWSGSGYHSLPPTRILDSRLPNVGFGGPVTSSTPRRLQVSGLGGPANVPASATAVVMNMTVTNSTMPSYLTVYPTGTSRPNASNLNFGTNQVIPNLVTVRVGAGGAVDVATAVGSTHVVADVVGYYDDGTGAANRFVPVAPVRLLDSRLPEPWGHPLSDARPEPLTVRSSYAATNAIPWTATEVVVNVTVTNGDFQSFLTVYPDGGAQPEVSNLNFLPGQTIANLAVVSLERGDADIRFANAIGSVDVIVDLVGYMDPTAGSRFHPLDPNRVLDTRTGVGLAGTQGPAQTRSLAVAGAPGTNVPAGATAIVANLTVADATAESYVSIFPGAQARPDPFSNVNFGINQVIPNLATVGLGPDGTVNLYNHLGRTHLIADVVGWYAPW